MKWMEYVAVTERFLSIVIVPHFIVISSLITVIVSVAAVSRDLPHRDITISVLMI